MPKSKYLHVVSFDNPFPPNYGGVIDVFYKIRALHEAGVRVILHAFEYGRKPAPELNAYCQKVYYYQRRNFVNPFIGNLPYIVNTRNSLQLLENLVSDSYPILFEGLHTCFFLNHPALKNRTKLVRTHNIEHEYYERLEAVEQNFFKKYFFAKESQRLLQFEPILKSATAILAISHGDEHSLKSRFKKVHYLPAFHGNRMVTAAPGKGNFALYHGKLSVGENDESARFLVDQVFSRTNIPLTIAGDKPSKQLRQKVAEHRHITLLDKLSTEQISQLISEAHVNVLPTFQNTGIKLKLLNVLFQGRHVLVNRPMVEHTGLEQICTVAEDATQMVAQLEAIWGMPFTQTKIDTRQTLLLRNFGDEVSPLLKWL